MADGQNRTQEDADARPAPWQRWLVFFFLTLLVLPPLLIGAWAWITLHINYSTGERAGFVQKISNKGWLCKTWEGELAMATLPGTMPQIFSFSVRDEKVAQEISRTIGQRVQLSYAQHKAVPTSCFGETDYFVTSIKPVSDVENFPAASPNPVPSTVKP